MNKKTVPTTDNRREAGDETRMLVEVGWIVCGKQAAAERKAILAARERCLDYLRQHFPNFDWQMPLLYRNTSQSDATVEPTDLLYEASFERDSRHWDIGLIVTQAELKTYEKSFAYAVPSKALNVAVLSLARLEVVRNEDNDATAIAAARLQALVMHIIGDLNGLNHCADAVSFMYVPQALHELEKMQQFTPRQQALLDELLTEVADLRVEETLQPNHAGFLRFYFHALAVGFGPIARALWEAQPWRFPFYLSRLTLASVSALVILLITAEAWDLAMAQPVLTVQLFAASMVLATSVYIVRKQNLLMRSQGGLRTEQLAVSNATATLLVLLGMLVTYLLMVLLALIVGQLFFSQALLDQWTPAMTDAVNWSQRLSAAGFFASVSIVVGALGASFEGQQYVAHVVYAGEEL